ncbi:formimidoylglutamase [Rummeliibacillus stabekisii]|uniref:formimidoylglutamase n=1 Tax=Rummeliibacillus stabekisii TaxID=241244 RepID=UPI00203B5AF4|nr:formimidoylglutamase [Rummeliibacillus stabekisii]MCM3316641.1 formimidoylglutamase [Rummeliibacillus stabekisii]
MFKKPDDAIWDGRLDDSENRESFRYHQVVKCQVLDGTEENVEDMVTLIGFACDEGVRRNHGRVGAKKAPDEIRAQLASMPFRGPLNATVIDAGTIVCEENELEAAQEDLGKTVAKALNRDVPCIVLGGGHETLYGQYLGVREHVGKEAKIGLLNIDAHFDMRPYDEQPSSGTMFKQILDQDPHAKYFVCGIQRYGNTTELFRRADELGVTYLFEDEMTDEATKASIKAFVNDCDVVLLTLCMDAISAAHAPGVSAPAPFGLEPLTVRTLIREICKEKKVTSFSLCEVNPVVDENNRTSRLAAHIINEATMSFWGR